MRLVVTLCALTLLAGCGTVPARPLPISPYLASPATLLPASYEVVDEGAAVPRRSTSVISADVSELYEPRFSAAVAEGLERHLAARLSGQGAVRVRALVQPGEVVVERGAPDIAPVVGSVVAAVRARTFIANGSIVFEVERDGRVERTYTLRHSTRYLGSLVTDGQRAASTAGATEQWRREAFAKADAEFLARYL